MKPLTLADIAQRGDRSTRIACPPEIIDRVTDILAEMLLEDLKPYPRISTRQPIDTFYGRENTELPAQEGRA